MRWFAQTEIGRTLAAVGLILVAILLWSRIPNRPESYVALPVSGQLGEQLIGRNISTTVHGVYSTKKISIESKYEYTAPSDYTSTGIWIVVDLTCMTLVESSKVVAYLQAGDVRTAFRSGFSSSLDIPDSLQPGLQYRFVIVFDIPDGGGNMMLSVMNAFKDIKTGLTMDPPLDSRLDIKIPSRDIESRPVVTIKDAEVRT